MTIELKGEPKELIEFLANMSVKKTNITPNFLGRYPTPEEVDRMLERLRNENNEDPKS